MAASEGPDGPDGGPRHSLDGNYTVVWEEQAQMAPITVKEGRFTCYGVEYVLSDDERESASLVSCRRAISIA